MPDDDGHQEDDPETGLADAEAGEEAPSSAAAPAEEDEEPAPALMWDEAFCFPCPKTSGVMRKESTSKTKVYDLAVAMKTSHGYGQSVRLSMPIPDEGTHFYEYVYTRPVKGAEGSPLGDGYLVGMVSGLLVSTVAQIDL